MFKQELNYQEDLKRSQIHSNEERNSLLSV